MAVDRSGNLAATSDFRAEVREICENLKAVIPAPGRDFNSAIKLNYYCSESVDPSQIPIVRSSDLKTESTPHFASTKTRNIQGSAIEILNRPFSLQGDFQ